MPQAVPGPVLVFLFLFHSFLYCTNIYLYLNRLRVQDTNTTTTTSVAPNDDKRGKSGLRRWYGSFSFILFTVLMLSIYKIRLRCNDHYFHHNFRSTHQRQRGLRLVLFKGLTSDKSVNIHPPLVYPTLGMGSWPGLPHREGAIKLQ